MDGFGQRMTWTDWVNGCLQTDQSVIIRMVKHHPSSVRMVSQKKKVLTPEQKMSGEEEGGASDRGFHVDDEHRVTGTTRQRIESTE